MVIDKESLNELVLVIIEYLNMFLLFGYYSYYRSVNVLLKIKMKFIKCLKHLSLDASISIASYLSDVTHYSNPTFNTSSKISFIDMYHPLIIDHCSELSWMKTANLC